MSGLYYNLLLVLGAVVSYEDWKEKKIRNRWILAGLALCGIGLGWLLWNSFLGHRGEHLGLLGEYYLPWSYYPRVGVHMVLSFTASWVLWHFSIWPAGDAKLFIVFALFASIIDPNIPGFPLLLFMVLLINIFIPAGLLFVAEFLLRALRGLPELARADWGKGLKAVGETALIRLKDAWPFRYDYLMLGVNLFAMFYAMVVIMTRFQEFALGAFGHLVVFLLMLVVWGRLMMVLRDKRVGVAAMVCVSGLMLFGALRWDWDVTQGILSALKMTLSFGMFLSVCRVIFPGFIEWESRRELRPEHLQPGVILSDETWDKLKSEAALEGKFEDRYSDGLSEEEVEILKAWLAESGGPGGGASQYMVYQTIPFAVWILLGTLLTLSWRTTLISRASAYVETLEEEASPRAFPAEQLRTEPGPETL